MADLLVIGGGMAGLAAGAAAAEAGAHVTGVEKSRNPGGSAGMPAGTVLTAPDYAALRRRGPGGDPWPAQALIHGVWARVGAGHARRLTASERLRARTGEGGWRYETPRRFLRVRRAEPAGRASRGPVPEPDPVLLQPLHPGEPDGAEVHRRVAWRRGLEPGHAPPARFQSCAVVRRENSRAIRGHRALPSRSGDRPYRGRATGGRPVGGGTRAGAAGRRGGGLGGAA